MLLERTRIGRQMRLYQGSVHTFEVEPLLRALREEPEYLQYGRDGVTLVKTPELRVVLEVLGTGSRMQAHQERGPITLHLLEGELRFEAGEEVLYLRGGEILAMPVNRPYAVEAVTDAAFLLTLGFSKERGVAPRPPVPPNLREADADRGPTGQVQREWETVQERFPADWPAEGGNAQG